jgi:hypothetical protein
MNISQGHAAPKNEKKNWQGYEKKKKTEFLPLHYALSLFGGKTRLGLPMLHFDIAVHGCIRKIIGWQSFSQAGGWASHSTNGKVIGMTPWHETRDTCMPSSQHIEMVGSWIRNARNSKKRAHPSKGVVFQRIVCFHKVHLFLLNRIRSGIQAGFELLEDA